MCENIKKTPNTGTAIISAANGNLNGTGAIVDIITGTLAGTEIHEVTIKSQGNNAQGMVRLFVTVGAGYSLIQEVMIPATVPTGVVQSFSATITSLINLQSGEKLAASTQNAEVFSIIASGVNIEYCKCP